MQDFINLFNSNKNLYYKSYIEYKILGYNTSSPTELTNNKFKRHLKENLTTFKILRKSYDVSINESIKNHTQNIYMK